MALFSVIIPVYNEARRIPRTLPSILDFFSAHGPNAAEIIFVDDGSTDDTVSVLKRFDSNGQLFRIVGYSLNKGKGYAVRQGALSATGDYVVFFDIDLATPLSEFSVLKAMLAPTDGVVIGSRRLGQSRIEKSQSGLRVFLGQNFTRLSNLFVPGVTDFTCGFKCFSRSAASVIFPRARIDRWAFDTELLYIAHIHGVPIREMPVSWRHDDDSRVRVGSAVTNAIIDLCRMAGNRLMGRYS